MIEHLSVINLPPGVPPLPSPIRENRPFFLLNTCLRTLILDLNYSSLPFSSNNFSSSGQQVLKGEEAYIFVLEVLCGLKSKILAENEIVSQYKTAYLDYLKSRGRHPLLIKILEKLLKDAKEIRRQFLMGVAQKSYAALARKLVLQKGPVPEVLILGSGDLAVDIIHQLKKKVNLTLSARNKEKVEDLSAKHQIKTLPWSPWENSSPFRNFSHIICAIGTETVLWGPDFFQEWLGSTPDHRLFLDLGSPSPIGPTPGQKAQGIIDLKDLFLLEKDHQEQKQHKVQLAREHISRLVLSRKYFSPVPIPLSELSRGQKKMEGPYPHPLMTISFGQEKAMVK